MPWSLRRVHGCLAQFPHGLQIESVSDLLANSSTRTQEEITMKKLTSLFAFAFALSLVAPAFAEETANAPAKEEKTTGAGEKKKDAKAEKPKTLTAASEEKAEKTEKAEKKSKKKEKAEKPAEEKK